MRRGRLCRIWPEASCISSSTHHNDGKHPQAGEVGIRLTEHAAPMLLTSVVPLNDGEFRTVNLLSLPCLRGIIPPLAPHAEGLVPGCLYIATQLSGKVTERDVSSTLGL